LTINPGKPLVAVLFLVDNYKNPRPYVTEEAEAQTRIKSYRLMGNSSDKDNWDDKLVGTYCVGNAFFVLSIFCANLLPFSVSQLAQLGTLIIGLHFGIRSQYLHSLTSFTSG
jgi:hypothetical protein